MVLLCDIVSFKARSAAPTTSSLDCKRPHAYRAMHSIFTCDAGTRASSVCGTYPAVNELGRSSRNVNAPVCCSTLSKPPINSLRPSGTCSLALAVKPGCKRSGLRATHFGRGRQPLLAPLHAATVPTPSAGTAGPEPTAEQQLSFGSSLAQGLREGMEDELLTFFDHKNGRLLAGVFDGHCGAQASAWLKAELHKVLAATLPKGGLYLPDGAVAKADIYDGSSKVDGSGVYGAALTKAFLEADRLLIAHLARLGGDNAIEGSTATVAIVTPGASVVVAHVGDSQAVLCRNGTAMPLATPHRVSGVSAPAKAEIARVQSVGGWVDDGRVCGFLAVSRALGDSEYKGAGLPTLLQKGVDFGFWDEEFVARQKFTGDPVVALPAVSETPLVAEDELLIVASDGLWDVMAPSEVVKWARNAFKAKRSAEDVAAGLVDLAIKRHSADNVSVVVIDLVGQSYWNPPRGAVRGGKPGIMAQLRAFIGK